MNSKDRAAPEGLGISAKANLRRGVLTQY